MHCVVVWTYAVPPTYLWESREAADAFYSSEWMAGVTERWGAAPVRDDWVVPVVAESTAGQVVTG